jgi:Replication-relaxation
MNLSNLDGRSSDERRAKLRRKKRYRRDQRPVDPGMMYLTPQDRDVIQKVYQYRILSQRQLEALLGRSRGTVQGRLIRLYHHQFLDRVFLPVVMGQGRSPTLYVLDKNGIALLREAGVGDFSGRSAKKLTGLFIYHTLAINDVRIAVELACRDLGWRVERWTDENEIKTDYDKVSVRLSTSTKPDTISIVPDSYFVVDIPGKGVSNFFLEVDRGTETIAKFKSKASGYVAYYKLGLFEKRFNASGFRVLTVIAPSKLTSTIPTVNPYSRLNSLKGGVESIAGLGRRFWFGTIDDVNGANILADPIWYVSGSHEPTSLFTVDS